MSAARCAAPPRLFLVLAFVAPLAVSIDGQTQQTTAAPTKSSNTAPTQYVPKRLPDGQPDIQGVYLPSVAPNAVIPIERFTEEEREAYNRQMLQVRGPNVPAHGAEWTEGALRAEGSRIKPGMVLVVDPPDGRIPWQPWALAKRNYIRDHPYERAEFLDPQIRCLPVGTPRMTLGGRTNAYQVLQPPGHVVILGETNHLSRIIPLDGSLHLGRDMELWMGDSRGHWEGQTLVVDVTNFTDKTWVTGEPGGEGMSAGSFHSQALHLIERFTIVDADHIDYEALIEDPNVFTHPWKMRYDVWKRAPADYELLEYACHEGNKLPELVKSSFTKPSPSPSPSAPKR